MPDNHDIDAFEAERARLLGVAYRMLGSWPDAEDIVQEAWLRWHRNHGVDNPAAWLTTAVTRLSIDRLRQLQRRRTDHVGPWLPDPVAALAEAAPDPADDAVLAESVTMGFLAMLESLDPVDRAVLLLHDVFGFSFPEIGAMVDRSPAACRQIAKRARDRVAAHRAGRARLTGAPARERVEACLLALASGDPTLVLSHLSPDVVLVSDGGRQHRAARRPVVGPHRVSRLLTTLTRRLMERELDISLSWANGSPAIVGSSGGVARLVTVFDVSDRGVERVWSVLGADRLTGPGLTGAAGTLESPP